MLPSNNFHAVVQGEAKCVKNFIKAGHGVNSNYRVNGGRHPLHYPRYRKIADFYCDTAADTDANKTKLPLQNLFDAAIDGDEKAAHDLFTAGQYINEYDRRGLTPLHYTVQYEHTNIIKIYCKNGADVTADKVQLPPQNLFDAAKVGDEKVVQDLIATGHNVNVYDYRGQTPLHYAARYGHVNTARILCDNGAEVHAVPIKLPPKNLFDAAKIGDVQNVRDLLSAGQSVNNKDSQGRTPLHYAAIYKKQSIYEIILQAGADVNAVDNYGKAPLCYANGFL